jgi:hypothetical protein
VTDWKALVIPEHSLLIVEERLREDQTEGVRMLKGMPLEELAQWIWSLPRRASFLASERGPATGRALLLRFRKDSLIAPDHPIRAKLQHVSARLAVDHDRQKVGVVRLGLIGKMKQGRLSVNLKAT